MSQRSTEQHTTDETAARGQYPGADDPVERGLDQRYVGPSRWRTVLVIVVVVLVVLMLVALHLTGAVGPRAH